MSAPEASGGARRSLSRPQARLVTLPAMTDRSTEVLLWLFKRAGLSVSVVGNDRTGYIVETRDGQDTYRIHGPKLYPALIELAGQTGFDLEG